MIDREIASGNKTPKMTSLKEAIFLSLCCQTKTLSHKNCLKSTVDEIIPDTELTCQKSHLHDDDRANSPLTRPSWNSGKLQSGPRVEIDGIEPSCLKLWRLITRVARPLLVTQANTNHGWAWTEQKELLDYQTAALGNTDSVHFQNSVMGKCCAATMAHKTQ